MGKDRPDPHCEKVTLAAGWGGDKLEGLGQGGTARMKTKMEQFQTEQNQ